jgi:hypothetical protein
MKMLKENKRLRKAQDEMVGFALIVIIIAVVFIVIVSVYIRKPQEKTQDYEVNSFVQALLQYTTTCEEENNENLTIQELLNKCQEGNPCYYNEIIHRESNPCKILNDTIKEVVKASWETGIKGYWFNITISKDGETEEQILNIKEGVVTKNYRTGGQDLPPKAGSWEYAIILFDVYS